MPTLREAELALLAAESEAGRRLAARPKLPLRRRLHRPVEVTVVDRKVTGTAKYTPATPFLFRGDREHKAGWYSYPFWDDGWKAQLSRLDQDDEARRERERSAAWRRHESRATRATKRSSPAAHDDEWVRNDKLNAVEASNEEPRIFEEIRRNLYENSLPESDSGDSRDSRDSGGSDTDFRD